MMILVGDGEDERENRREGARRQDHLKQLDEVGHDPEATTAAKAAVKSFLRGVFKLE